MFDQDAVLVLKYFHSIPLNHHQQGGRRIFRYDIMSDTHGAPETAHDPKMASEYIKGLRGRVEEVLSKVVNFTLID